MWTTVHLVTGLEEATKIESQLKNEGFLVKKQLFYQEGINNVYEIIAPEFEADDIHTVLFDLGII